MSERRVTIIGAGVAGLATAWWLTRIGWRATILERASDLRSVGYMIGLSGPGLEIAKRMGIAAKLEAAACVINENVYRDRKGRELLRLRYREFLRDLPHVALRRTELVETLREAVAPDVDIRFSTEAESIVDRDEAVTVRLKNGETLQSDLLVGADGFRSRVRREIFGPDENYFKPLGYRFATYDFEDKLNLGADFLSYTEPGDIVEYYTLRDGRLAALHVWCSKINGPVAPESRWPMIEDISKTTHENVRSMIAIAKQEGAPIVDDLTLVEMPKWSKGRVLLLGDSAHCLTLISGQGAGMAMTSAAILSDELKTAPLPEALKRHEARLRPSITKLQERSRKMGKMFIPETPMAFSTRNFVLRNMPRSWLGRYFHNAVKSEILATGGAA